MKKPRSRNKNTHLAKHLRYLKILNNTLSYASINRKKQRFRANTEDRLSKLPHDLLMHILSFLPIKTILQTRTLSKRWYHLRYSFHNLEFVIQESPEKFVKTVDLFLRRHGGSEIHRFHLLFLSGDEYSSETMKWIEFAIRGRVKELDLDFSQGDFKGFFELPSCIFHCGTIRTLNLNLCDFNTASFGGLTLTTLKSLSLKKTLITTALIGRIIFHCRVLESLELSDCMGLKYLKVSAPDLQLKYLIVRHCLYLEGVEISAPKLVSFEYHGVFVRFSFKDISCLSDLTLDVLDLQPSFTHIEADLSQIEILTVPSSVFMWLHRKLRGQMCGRLPILFHNLKELHLLNQTTEDGELLKLTQYLEIYPDLHEISIKLATSHYWFQTETDSEQTMTKSYDCKFNLLKTVRIKEFRGKNDEIWLGKYFLEKAIVLESLILIARRLRDVSVWDVESQVTFELVEELGDSSRASSDAKIILYSGENNGLIWKC